MKINSDELLEKSKKYIVSDFEEFMVKTQERHNNLKNEMQAQYDDLPEYLKIMVDNELKRNPAFLLKELPEYLMGATEGLLLAKKFDSYSAWQKFARTPEDMAKKLSPNIQLTNYSINVAIDVCNGYIERNYSKIILPK